MKDTLTKQQSGPDQAGLHYLLTHIVEDFMRSLRATGLSRPQIHALLHIYHAGECRMSEISGLSGSSAAAASQLVERLVRQGLVERLEVSGNRRSKRLRLTDRALRLLQEGMASNDFLESVMHGLTSQQRQVVHTAMGYLVRAAPRTHSHTPQRNKRHA